MKWASLLLVLAAGCGAVPVEVLDQEQSPAQAVPECLRDSDCDDGIFCNGAETCIAQECRPGVFPCPGFICEEVGTLCRVLETPDACPDDPEKIEPGICGCNVAETDADSDGTPDCLDGCPDDPNKTTTGLCGCGHPDIGIDSDADGVPDCIDLCPLDPIKLAPGICGCRIDDLDLDRDGFPDLCLDNCPFTFNPDQLDSDSDGSGDACDSFPVGPGDVFSFLTPDQTELFLIFVARLNADIDSFVDSALALELFDLGSRGFSCSSAVCNAECGAEQSRISLKRDGTALSAIDAATSFGINLTLGLFERQEIDAFNCENYPNRSFNCTRTLECGLPSILCTVGGPPCD